MVLVKGLDEGEGRWRSNHYFSTMYRIYRLLTSDEHGFETSITIHESVKYYLKVMDNNKNRYHHD
jgi:hypothetical protein